MECPVAYGVRGIYFYDNRCNNPSYRHIRLETRMSAVDPVIPSLARLKKEQRSILLWLSLLFLAFAAVIALSLFVVLRVLDEQEFRRSELLARTAAAKDVELRDWMAVLGGIFAPVTEATPPNPYLSPVDREIAGPDGRLLTKMNPAYVTRLLHERWGNKYGMIGHITSLQPIRPQNAAQPWEAEALSELTRRGGGEYYAIHVEKGARYMRHMTPLVARPGCLTCHTTQGYKVGDIMGGISNTMPTVLVTGGDEELRQTVLVGHAAVLIFVAGLFWWGGRSLLRRNDQRYKAEIARHHIAETLEERIDQRTVELQKYRQSTETILSSTLEGIVEVDKHGVIVFINKAGAEMTGYACGEKLVTALQGTLLSGVGHGKGCECPLCMVMRGLRRRFTGLPMLTRDDDTIFVDGSAAPIQLEDQQVGSIFVFHNITEYSRLQSLQQAIFQSSTEPFLLFTPRRLSACNSAAVAFFGARNEEELCRDFLLLSPPQQENGCTAAQRLEQAFDECDRYGKTRFHWVHVHADGTLLPCLVSMAKMTHPLYSGYLSSMTDLRTIRHYEQQQEKDKALLHSVVNASPLPMFIIDAADSVRCVNTTAERLLPLTLGSDLDVVLADKQPWQNLRDRLQLGQGVVSGTVALHTRRDTNAVETQISMSLVTFDGQSCVLVWVSMA